jgi:transcriptional regulator with XRE-family HTH domain
MRTKRPDGVDKIVGRNIRIYRLTRGLSQTDLGNKVGVTFQQIQKYEKGVNRVGSGRLFEMSRVLGISVLSLFEGTETSSSKKAESSPLNLLADPLSRRLVQAFSDISESQTRHSLVVLVESMVGGRKT